MIEKKNLNLFEKKIGYKFKNIIILKKSLTHPSLYKDKKTKENDSNQFERFEFLGDRVLGLIVSSLLFTKFKKLNEGDLSKKYSYLVQKNFLYKISIELSLDEILLFNFTGKNKKMFISILSDAVESLIGGMFIDGGYQSSYNFVKKFWTPHLDLNVSKIEDPKTALQELSQKKIKKLPKYEIISKKGPAHSPLFTISLKVLDLKKIKASGYSIREAEKNAASEALKLINEKETS